jgi:hypothetical protein
MAKVQDPELGWVSERTFPSAAVDAGLRSTLESFLQRDVLSYYAIENGILTLKRRWIEGQISEEVFRDLPAQERFALSIDLFRLVHSRLETMGQSHGALHARNIIVLETSGFELVDRTFNSVTLAPRAVEQNDPWLWGPCIPKDWSAQDWDLVSLLRTATLLAEEPSAWNKQRKRREVVKLCRRWAERVCAADTPPSFFTAIVEKARDLLDDILTTSFDLPPEPVKEPEKPSSLLETGDAARTSPTLAYGEVEDRPEAQKSRFFLVPRKFRQAFRRNRRAWQICAWLVPLALAVLGLIASVHGTIFGDLRDWRTALWGPTEVERIDISSLMSNSPARDVVYVFALDVSGSLSQKSVLPGEIASFRERISADRLVDAPHREEIARRCGLEASELSQWHLARAQICHYLHSIEDGAYVGLWKFGDVPTQKSASRAEQLELNRRATEEGKRKLLIESLMGSDLIPRRGTLDFENTNFEALFAQLYAEYVASTGFRDKEVRFVIVSDFLHYAGVEDPAQYSLSRQRIEKKLEEFKSAANVTFHLVEVGAQRTNERSILASIEKSTRWDQHVVDSLQREPADPRPDFLYGFLPAERNLVFRYSSDSESVHPIELIWDDGISESDDSDVIVEFRPDEHTVTDHDLSIRVSVSRTDKPCIILEDGVQHRADPRNFQTADLKLKDRQRFVLERPGDWICLQPRSIDKQRVYRYQLVLSCVSDRSRRYVQVVDVRMQRYLPKPAAWVVVISVAVLLLAPLACSLMTLGTFVLERRRVRKDLAQISHR